MERRFIPSSSRASSPTPSRSSKPSAPWPEPFFLSSWSSTSSSGATGAGREPNRFSSPRPYQSLVPCPRPFALLFRPLTSPPRRVMGAWWPSRSSKPLSARSAGRGVFDSLPLRQDDLRFTVCDLRIWRALARRARKSAFENRKSAKGGDGVVA